MTSLEELRFLKETYEHSLQQYERTRHPQHYVLYQKTFRDYRHLIDQYGFRSQDVEPFLFSDQEKGVKVQKTPSVPSVKVRRAPYQKRKPSVQEIRGLQWQEKILEILTSAHKRLSIREISSSCGLGESQVWRYLNRLHLKDLVRNHSIVINKSRIQVWESVSSQNVIV